MSLLYSPGSTLGKTVLLIVLGSLMSCGSVPLSKNETKPVNSSSSNGYLKTAYQTNTGEVQKRNFRKSMYASTGVGLSMLEPDNSQIPTWEVTDSVNTGGQITVGADINRHFSAEFHSADLGSAGVAQTNGEKQGRVNYHLHGLSALWYAGKNRHRQKRQGLTGFGRAGFARMDNSPVGDAPYRQVNSTQFLLGAGVEYTTRSGLGLRAEFISFDTDAQYGQLGLVYRMQRKNRQRTEQKLVATPTPLEIPAIEKTPVVAAAKAAPVDSDRDGIVDDIDNCASSTPGIAVGPDGCAVFEGVLKGVTFYSASERLTPQARAVLDSAAVTLGKFPDTKIRVMAHTDDRGSAEYNQNLSFRRANSVTKYLAHKGISKSRLKALAFGETKPIESNNTSQGRANNRRVELEAVN